MTETVKILIPEYGVLLHVHRTDEGPWIVRFTGNMTTRQRKAKRPPRGSALVIGHARPEPFGYPPARPRRKRPPGNA